MERGLTIFLRGAQPVADFPSPFDENQRRISAQRAHYRNLFEAGSKCHSPCERNDKQVWKNLLRFLCLFAKKIEYCCYLLQTVFILKISFQLYRLKSR